MKKSDVFAIIEKLPAEWLESSMILDDEMKHGISFIRYHYWYFPYRLIRRIELTPHSIIFYIQKGIFNFSLDRPVAHCMFVP